MKKSDLVKREARRTGHEQGKAADDLDRAVSHILRVLRSGQPAVLPGLGTITPGRRWTFRREQP